MNPYKPMLLHYFFNTGYEWSMVVLWHYTMISWLYCKNPTQISTLSNMI